MASLRLLTVILCMADVLASPRDLLLQKVKRYSGSGGGSGQPSHPHDDNWIPKSDEGPSKYGGSWDHSSSSETPKSPYGSGSDDWGHSSTCAALTITETSISTLFEPTSTVYISESGYTSFPPVSTVYVSGSGHTSFLPASIIYISGSDHTSILPASTEEIPGPVQTIVLTSCGTLTKQASPTTAYITRIGHGWNHTVTRAETDVLTTTHNDYSTIYNEETTTLTSVVTLPGEQLLGAGSSSVC